jgi:hypothetical protein
VCWEHEISPGGQKFTRCELHDIMRLEDPPTKDNISVMPSYEGMSVCSMKDQFCKDTGRKKSLSRALSNNLVFPREVRKKFWDAYFEMQHVCYDPAKLAKTLNFMTYEKVGP